jgi:RNase P/RNase MRP subunit p29
MVVQMVTARMSGKTGGVVVCLKQLFALRSRVISISKTVKKSALMKLHKKWGLVMGISGTRMAEGWTENIL